MLCLLESRGPGCGGDGNGFNRYLLVLGFEVFQALVSVRSVLRRGSDPERGSHAVSDLASCSRLPGGTLASLPIVSVLISGRRLPWRSEWYPLNTSRRSALLFFASSMSCLRRGEKFVDHFRLSSAAFGVMVPSVLSSLDLSGVLSVASFCALIFSMPGFLLIFALRLVGCSRVLVWSPGCARLSHSGPTRSTRLAVGSLLAQLLASVIFFTKRPN